MKITKIEGGKKFFVRDYNLGFRIKDGEFAFNVNDENVFTITQDNDSRITKTSGNKIEIDISKLNQLKLLLVEDNHFNQMVAIDILKNQAPDVQIVAVGNGREAIEQLAEQSFDVILMDVQMPEMDGYEATRYIRLNLKDRRAIPILAMTASATKTEIDQCLDCGMDDFISKPFIPEELFRKIVTLATR